MSRTRLALGLCGVVALSACGGGTPSKADFIAEVRTTLGDDIASGVGVNGVDTKKLNTLVDDFLGCTYDAVKSDPTLLEQMYKDPSFSSATTGSSEKTSELRTKADQLSADCVSELNKSATEVLSGEG